MRSIAETGKGGPLAHTAAAALVVGVVMRHRTAAVASACLTVDAADDFLHNHCPNSRGFIKGFFLAWFSIIMDYHFLTDNYYSLPCVLSCTMRLRLKIRKGTHNF